MRNIDQIPEVEFLPQLTSYLKLIRNKIRMIHQNSDSILLAWMIDDVKYFLNISMINQELNIKVTEKNYKYIIDVNDKIVNVGKIKIRSVKVDLRDPQAESLLDIVSIVNRSLWNRIIGSFQDMINKLILRIDCKMEEYDGDQMVNKDKVDS